MGKFAQAAEVRERVDTTCNVGKKVIDFDDDDTAAFVRLLEGRKVRVIQDLFGGSPGEHAIRRHGKGRCACPDSVPGKGVALGG